MSCAARRHDGPGVRIWPKGAIESPPLWPRYRSDTFSGEVSIVIPHAAAGMISTSLSRCTFPEGPRGSSLTK